VAVVSDQERTLPGQGREAEVFLQADGTVLKLMRNPEWERRVQREATALLVRANGQAGPAVHRIISDDIKLEFDELTQIIRRSLLRDRP
jgi:hypothetical protein